MSDPLPKPPETPPAETRIQPGLPTAPEPLATTPREEIAYQPLSGFAIAGFSLGVIFALLVVASTAVALQQGAPFFLPIAVIFIAIIGLVFSLIGQWHVQKSEGTRAGAKLARIGMWLSIVSGLCYLSYYFMTGLALEGQANAFLMEKSDDDSGLFPRLREGAAEPIQLNAAFLLTRPQRSARPDNELDMIKDYDIPNKDGSPGDLTSFKYGLAPGTTGMFPRIFFGNSAKDAEVIPQGVQEWKYEQKHYQVRRNYRVKTKEIDWQFTLLVISTEAETTGQGRKWFLNLAQSSPIPEAKKLTPFGEGMRYIRWQAKLDLEKWVAKLNEGNAFANIKDMDRTEWGKKFGDDYVEKRDLIYKTFRDDSKGRLISLTVFTRGDEIGFWEEVNDKVRMHTPFRIAIGKGVGQPPAYFLDGMAVHETVRGGLDVTQVDQQQVPDLELISIGFIGVSPYVAPKNTPGM